MDNEVFSLANSRLKLVTRYTGCNKPAHLIARNSPESLWVYRYRSPLDLVMKYTGLLAMPQLQVYCHLGLGKRPCGLWGYLLLGTTVLARAGRTATRLADPASLGKIRVVVSVTLNSWHLNGIICTYVHIYIYKSIIATIQVENDT